jgi:hypothetical protein
LANGVSGSQETLIPFDIICPSNIPYPNYWVYIPYPNYWVYIPYPNYWVYTIS